MKNKHFAVLCHYGVPGMKWGVRKQYEGSGRSGGGGWGPNNPMMGNPLAAAAATMPKDPQGKKKVGKNAVKNMGLDTTASPEVAKKLFTFDTDARRKQSELNKERRAELEKLDRPKDYFGPDGKLTAEGRKALDAAEEIHNRYDEQERKLDDEHRREIRDMRQKVFMNEVIEPEVRAAKETLNKLDSVYTDNLGPNSPAYKEAFAKYKAANKDLDDAAYGFDHYEWRKGNKDYDAAYKAVQKEAKSLERQYENQVSSIGKKVLDNQYDRYKETAMIEVDQFISFRYDEFQSK